MNQPNLRGKRYRVKGGKFVPAPKTKKSSPHIEAARNEIARAHQKRWVAMLRIAREYTSRHRHANVAELIVYFNYKKIPLPEEVAKKLLSDIARDKKK